MRLRITAKAGYENPRRGVKFATGDVVEVDDDLAVKLMNAGLAVPAPKPAVKTAAAPAQPETAAKVIEKPKPKASKRSTPAKEEAEA